MKKIIRYLRPLWEGDDKKISLKGVASIFLIIDFVRNVHSSSSIAVKILNLILKDKQIDAALVAAMGGNIAQISMILGIEAALIAALLGLKTYQSCLTPQSPTCPEKNTEEGA